MIEPKQQILSKQVSEINKADYFVICALKQGNLSTFGSSGGVLKACNWNQVAFHCFIIRIPIPVGKELAHLFFWMPTQRLK